jgi:hypothetical protein
MKSPTVTRMPSLGTVGVPSRCFAPQSAGKRKLPTRIQATGRPSWKPGLIDPVPPSGTGTRSTPSVTLRGPVPPVSGKGRGVVDATCAVPPLPPAEEKCQTSQAPTTAATITMAAIERRSRCRRRTSSTTTTHLPLKDNRVRHSVEPTELGRCEVPAESQSVAEGQRRAIARLPAGARGSRWACSVLWRPPRLCSTTPQTTRLAQIRAHRRL